MASALSSVWRRGEEGAYIVRHGGRPVNDFGYRSTRAQGPVGAAILDESQAMDNIWEMSYPFLFPYGCGGLEKKRRVPVPVTSHMRWCLRFRDGRFRRQETFSFVAFAMLQKREALGSARLQMKRRQFEKDAHTIMAITTEQLRNAAEEEARGERFSDPAVRLLRSYVQATSGRVMGTDAARIRLRSQIWSTCISMGPPSLWVTINPSDLHDPLAQVFAGEDIVMNDFIRSAGPDKEARAKNVAKDPYASAKFFHYTIRALLKHVFGVTSTAFKTTSRMGVLGKIAAYFGTVE
ncbi:hypothetical protein K523DRAFT_251823, partial [Schizophyllum commune Tattone D]